MRYSVDKEGNRKLCNEIKDENYVVHNGSVLRELDGNGIPIILVTSYEVRKQASLKTTGNVMETKNGTFEVKLKPTVLTKPTTKETWFHFLKHLNKVNGK